MFDFQSIKPKGSAPKPNVQLALERMRLFGMALKARMEFYPSQRPWVRYRRTGRYGQSWTVRGPFREGGTGVVVIGNAMKYSMFVGGFKTRDPRQVRWAGPYGWRSIETEGLALWRQHLPGIERALKRGV